MKSIAERIAGELNVRVLQVDTTIALLDGFGDGLDDDVAVLALGVPPPASSSAADDARRLPLAGRRWVRCRRRRRGGRRR